jgi:hypothetical protein
MKLTIRGSALLTGALLAVLLQACGGGGGSDSSPPPPVQKYTLSGVVRPATGAAVDNDVNDPVAFYQPNNTVADAQPIPNPVTLGGYVNQPGSGPAGSFPRCRRCRGRLPGQPAGGSTAQLVHRWRWRAQRSRFGSVRSDRQVAGCCSEPKSRRVANGQDQRRLFGGRACGQRRLQLCADSRSILDGHWRRDAVER